MFRLQIRALRQILQPYGAYSVEVCLEKSLVQIQRFSSKSQDARVLNKISRLSTNELKNLSCNEWIDRINVLQAYRFRNSECFEMITEHPDILKIPLKKLENTVKQWSCTLDMDNFRNVLSSNPMLLEVEHHIIRKRVSQLLAVCGSSNLLAELLIKSPCVMFDDWNAVMRKINYLLKVRGFKINSIILSCGLSQSLDFIKFRFDILQKCGTYKQMSLHSHKINKYDPSQYKNPSLEDILQPDDEYFSSAVAKISLEEYIFCYEQFMEDAELTTDSDDDDDDDDDDSDNDDDK